jgi:acyl-CoA hydrolase
MTVATDANGLNLGAFLRPGDHIVWGQACGEPTTLVEALIAQAEGIGRLSAVAATGRLAIVPCHVSQVGPMISQGLAAGYINDGAVLQVGVGAVPDAILRLLRDRRDLGVHSGMIGDGLVDLVEAGVVTNALKTIDPGVSITGALIGTRRLYDFADRNPKINMRGCAYTHSAEVLSRLTRLVTINSAVEVDLTGQVNAEQSGEQYIGGTGGQVDYVRAGSRSPGGRSIIALPATAKGGKISRVVATLSGPVTTARAA